MHSPIIGAVVTLTFLGTSQLSAQTAPQDPFRLPVYDSLLLKSRTMDIAPLLPNCPMPVLRLSPDGQAQNGPHSLAPYRQDGSTKQAPQLDGCVNPLDQGPRPSWVPAS